MPLPSFLLSRHRDSPLFRTTLCTPVFNQAALGSRMHSRRFSVLQYPYTYRRMAFVRLWPLSS